MNPEMGLVGSTMDQYVPSVIGSLELGWVNSPYCPSIKSTAGFRTFILIETLFDPRDFVSLGMNCNTFR